VIGKRGGWRARRGLAGRGKRLKGLEPSTFCMASRTTAPTTGYRATRSGTVMRNRRGARTRWYRPITRGVCSKRAQAPTPSASSSSSFGARPSSQLHPGTTPRGAL